jgi:predicted nucleic acid-binding protein
VSVRLIYPDTRAALAQAERIGRLTARQLRAAVTDFNSLFEEIDLVEVDDILARRAGELAEVRRLRGYDAIHLAAAIRVHDPNVVVIAGDGALLDAAAAEGMTVAELP